MDYNEVLIQGTHVNLDDAELQDVKTAEEIPARYFEHLYGDKKEEAEKQLLKALKDDSKKKKQEAKESTSGDPKVMGTGKTKEELDKGL